MPSTPNDPRAIAAVGMLTAIIHGDQEGFLEMANEFDGGCAEALASLGKVAQAILTMWAETADTTPDEIMKIVATAIALGDDSID